MMKDFYFDETNIIYLVIRYTLWLSGKKTENILQVLLVLPQKEEANQWSLHYLRGFERLDKIKKSLHGKNHVDIYKAHRRW